MATWLIVEQLTQANNNKIYGLLITGRCIRKHQLPMDCPYKEQEHSKTYSQHCFVSEQVMQKSFPLCDIIQLA